MTELDLDPLVREVLADVGLSAEDASQVLVLLSVGEQLSALDEALLLMTERGASLSPALAERCRATVSALADPRELRDDVLDALAA